MEPSPIDDLQPRRDFIFPASWILLLLVVAILFGYLLGGALSALVAYATGTDLSALLSGFGENSSYEDRQILRWVSLLSHVASFTLPALGVFVFLYRKRWAQQLFLEVAPRLVPAGLSILFILVSFPFAQTVYWLNRQLPLPEWMASMEGDVSGLVEGLLVMKSPGELLFNLLVVAVVPAIGEELVFRGVVQQQFYRIARTPGLAVWITAFLFSAVHLQFEGFLPRFLLGALLGYLFLWSKNLWIPILAHFFFNGIQVAGQFFAGEALEALDTTQTDQPYWAAGIGSLILIFWIGYYFHRYFALPEKQEKVENESVI
jgi:membrane protease YdiL (CAAX protease family)